MSSQLLSFVAAFLTLLSPPQDTASVPSARDPLGRNTPRQTMINFLRESQAGNTNTAVGYLEIHGRPGSSSNASAAELARKLQTLLDRDLSLDLRNVSDTAEGNLDDFLPPNEENAGTITTGDAQIDITLRRMKSGETDIWLFSSQTLSALFGVADSLPPLGLERHIPAVLLRPLFLNVAGWRWIALVLLIPVAFLIAKPLSLLLVGIAGRIARRVPTDLDDRVIAGLPQPLRLFLAVLLFHAGMLYLSLPLLLRSGIGMLELVVALIAITWFAVGMVDLAFEFARVRLVHNNRATATAAIPLARRMVKVVAICIAFLFVLDNLGFDSKAALAGLGIGGIALALAAQKTLENVFSGVTLVLDHPVRVGEFCRFGEAVGTVEDIGLRSTRIRTLDQTVVTVPNAQFATMNIENFAARHKIWFHPTISVRFDTTPEQLQAVLGGIRKLLREDVRIEPGARVSLIGARPAFDLEIFSYAVTSDYNEFVIIQEDLLLRILEILHRAGTGLAAPVQISYLKEESSGKSLGIRRDEYPDGRE